MSSDRIVKINDLIRDEVGKILLDEMDLDGVLITVMRANTSRTLEHSTVIITVIPNTREIEVMKEINKNIYEIQQQLNRRLSMHPVPKLVFEVEKDSPNTKRIEELLENS